MSEEKKDEKQNLTPKNQNHLLLKEWQKYNDFVGQEVTIIMDIRTAVGYMQFVGKLEEETPYFLVMKKFKGTGRDQIPKGYIVKDRIAAIYLNE